MQSCTPAEKLLQRLLQSEKVRNTYKLFFEDDNGYTKISLHCFEMVCTNPENVEGNSSAHGKKIIFTKRKDFLC